MKIIADLHLHSKYSRATSKSMDLENLEKFAKVKGLNLLGTSDFTHPEWIKELKTNLTEDGSGILKTKTGFNFILQTEISLIYTDMGKGRKVHNIILAPNFDTVEQITEYLKKKGRIDYDGRPIFKIRCDELVEDLRSINTDIEVIPAHIWTPWFSLFGSMSGYDRIEDAFKDQTKHIHALETGLSSDPEMNWRLSSLDRFSLVSNSDSHSYWPWRIGREANVFEMKDVNYKELINILKTKQGFVETIEVDPSYGKYHIDGHRNCNISMEPKQALKHNNICPVCKKPLTIGVLHRVEELADREEGFQLKNAVPFRRLLPLSELISAVKGKAIATKSVWQEFNNLVKDGKTEFDVLLDMPLEQIEDEKLRKVIRLNREGNINVKPGYDGEYGIPLLDGKKPKQEKTEKDKPITAAQKGLGEYF